MNSYMLIPFALLLAGIIAWSWSMLGEIEEPVVQEKPKEYEAITYRHAVERVERVERSKAP